jgi:hypothetical protein
MESANAQVRTYQCLCKRNHGLLIYTQYNRGREGQFPNNAEEGIRVKAIHVNHVQNYAAVVRGAGAPLPGGFPFCLGATVLHPSSSCVAAGVTGDAGLD